MWAHWGKAHALISTRKGTVPIVSPPDVAVTSNLCHPGTSVAGPVACMRRKYRVCGSIDASGTGGTVQPSGDFTLNFTCSGELVGLSRIIGMASDVPTMTVTSAGINLPR